MPMMGPQKEMHRNKQHEQLQHVLEQLHELQEEVRTPSHLFYSRCRCGELVGFGR